MGDPGAPGPPGPPGPPATAPPILYGPPPGKPWPAGIKNLRTKYSDIPKEVFLVRTCTFLVKRMRNQTYNFALVTLVLYQISFAIVFVSIAGKSRIIPKTSAIIPHNYEMMICRLHRRKDENML